MRYFFSKNGISQTNDTSSHSLSLKSTAEFRNKTIPFSHIYVSSNDDFRELKKSFSKHEADDIQEFSREGKVAIEKHKKYPHLLANSVINSVSDFHKLINEKSKINILIASSIKQDKETFKKELNSLKQLTNLLAPVTVNFHIIQASNNDASELCAAHSNIALYQNCLPVNLLFQADFLIELNDQNSSIADSLPLVSKFQNISLDAPKVAVVIPHFGKQEKLNLCLDALIKVKGFNPRWLYLVDNNKQNRYFTIGVNHGMKQALKDGCDFYWVLNNDTQPYPEYIEATLNRFYANDKVGVVGGKNLVTSKPDRIFWGGSHRAFPNGVHKCGYVSKKTLRRPTQESWATFSSVIIRKETVQDCGLLDETMRMIFSDSDYCFQAGLHGWQTWYEPQAVLLHDTGVSNTAPSEAIIQIFRQDKRAFYRKWSTITQCSDPEKLQEAIFKEIGFTG